MSYCVGDATVGGDDRCAPLALYSMIAFHNERQTHYLHSAGVWTYLLYTKSCNQHLLNVIAQRVYLLSPSFPKQKQSLLKYNLRELNNGSDL